MSQRVIKGSKSCAETLKKEDVIQAVVICDNFSTTFHPITHSKPTSLIHLVNTPLLDYTLEFLALSGVQEVILFCASHTDLIKDHVKKSKWAEGTFPMVVNIIVSEGCRSLGDAMRDLDAKGVIRSDFILLCGDTVANPQLLPILELHKKFQKYDKGSVMTLIYKEAGPGHKSRSPDDETLLAVDSASHQVLFHQKIKPSSKKITFPLETFMDRPQVDVHYNLQDCQVCICSPAVPPLFSDNFDFQTRDDFVRGLLLNEEILASTIYWHKLEAAEYAARVTSWHMYQAISHDVIHRWVFPLVPDSSIDIRQEPYMFLRHNVYKQKSAKLAKGCVLEEDVVLAEGTTVGENTRITCSVIGRNCHIGNNVHITNSYIWDNVHIEDDCVIDFSVIAEDSILKSRVKLSQGCILGPGVVLTKGQDLQGLRIVSRPIKDDEDFEQDHEWECLEDRAFVLRVEKGQTDSEDEDREPQILGLTLDSEGGESEAESEELSASSEMSYRASPVPDDTNMFFNEVVDSLTRGYEDKLHCDNLILEINSSRYAYNVSVREVNYHVVKALLNLPPADNYLAELRLQLAYFLPILSNYVRNPEAQADCLQAIEAVATSRVELQDGLQKLLHLLYEKDLLGEEAILEWYKNPEEGDSIAVLLRKKVSPFIQWLEEADEESDSD